MKRSYCLCNLLEDFTVFSGTQIKHRIESYRYETFLSFSLSLLLANNLKLLSTIFLSFVSTLYLLGLILQLGTNRDHTVMVHLLTKAVSCSLFFNYCSLLRRLLNQKRNGFNNRAIFYCVLPDPVSIRYQRKTVRKYGTCCYTGLVSLQKIKAWLMV